jgi:HK97 family phage portal protein
MGLFDGIINRIARQVAGAMSTPNYPVNYKATYKNAGDESFIDYGYLTNADLYAMVQMDVRKFAAIPVNTYKQKAGEEKAYLGYKGLRYYLGHNTLKMQRKALEEVIDNNEISRLLRKPNPLQGADQFFQAVRGFYNLTGEAFIWKQRAGEGNQGKVIALWVLPTQYMTVKGSSESLFLVDSYMFSPPGSEDMIIPKEDMIHWKTWTPLFDTYDREQLRGVSPVKALFKTLTASNEATDAMVAMYQNGGAKGVLFNESLDMMNPIQKSQLDTVMRNKVNNKEVKASVAAFQGKWGYLDLGLTSVDMQLLESLKVTRKQFADCLGIPADLVEGDKTYANREQSMKDWVSNSIYPAWKSLCDELNRALVPEFGMDMSRIVIDVDISQLPEMQDDQKKLTEIAEKSWWMPVYDRQVFTGNEGDPKMKGVYLIPSGFQTMEQLTSDMGQPLDDSQINDLSKLYDARPNS